MTEERCSCGARPKHKCSVESGAGGKMCFKDKNPQTEFDKLVREREEKYPEEMAEAREWAKDFIERWKADPSLVEITEINLKA